MTSHYRWPVYVGMTLAASPDDVWAVLSTRGHLTLFHPFVERNPVVSWPGPNSQDFVYYRSGLVLERNVTHWDEKRIELLVGRPGGQQSKVRWQLDPHGSNATELTLTMEPNLLQRVPWPLRAIPFYLAIIPSIRRYFSLVLMGLDFHLRTAKIVSPDQFGRHPVFSRQKNN